MVCGCWYTAFAPDLIRAPVAESEHDYTGRFWPRETL
jgi:hypothetical protein